MNKRSLVVLMLVACATAGVIQAGQFADKRAAASNALRRGDLSLAEALFREGAPKGAKYQNSLNRLREEYNEVVASRGAAAAAAAPSAPAAMTPAGPSASQAPSVPVPSPLHMKQIATPGMVEDLRQRRAEQGMDVAQRALQVAGEEFIPTPQAQQAVVTPQAGKQYSQLTQVEQAQRAQTIIAESQQALDRARATAARSGEELMDKVRQQMGGALALFQPNESYPALLGALRIYNYAVVNRGIPADANLHGMLIQEIMSKGAAANLSVNTVRKDIATIEAQ